MKWAITGILAVSAAAALANSYMTLSNGDNEAPPAASQSKEVGDTSAATAIAKERAFMTFSNNGGGSPANMEPAREDGDMPNTEAIAKERAFMTFSNDGNKPDGEFYTTPGGCTSPRPPKVEDHRIRGASSLRFMESSYIHQVAASLEAANGKCTCELRFPSWDAAFKDMEERFLSLPDDDSSEWVRDYSNADHFRLTREIDKLCKAQGVY